MTVDAQAPPAAAGASPVIEVASGVWLAAADVDDVPVSTHPGDRHRADGMPGWRAREFLAGRGLLRELLARTRPAAARVGVLADPGGRPRLDGHPGVGVSVSHDGGTVAVAVALGRPVGVDVQHPRAPASRALARRCLHGCTVEFDSLPAAEAARELAWVWTAQEACVKATGQGMTGRPWTIDVPLGACRGTWRGLRWQSLRGHFATPLSCAFPARADAADPSGIQEG
ncbi:4-phosphopantetheinyl transferase [Streptomyces solincola]|uniref:4-phosphopantetheinyl transferase n=1 Tax=Streptomyces solincola TaxID=2100817 RepID=A0A2S9PU18_9ACTN|nr:4'-phosphopantetheinyl transferase superfamily protein [Streptomyces solincola]PRH77895.1 4-phosphopantetheinyl transferase [Streptomyces solincola]